MACDTFIKIANKCRRHFVALQPGESEPFIEEIVRTMRKITIDLTPQQVHTFYEACGYMISAQGQKNIQERLIQELMSYPNQAVSTNPTTIQGRTLIISCSGTLSSTKRIRTLLVSRTAKQSKLSVTSWRLMSLLVPQSAAISILRLDVFIMICCPCTEQQARWSPMQ